MPSFGRLPAKDERDWPLAKAASLLPTELPTWKFWMRGPVLDQGQFPHCVAFAWKGWLMASPIRQGKAVDAADVYHQAQLIDEWPGEGYDGTSVRAGAKVLTQRGFVASYLFTWSADEIRNWILGKGPVVLGTTWYEGMSSPDEKGYANISGAVQGGHAYLALGYSAKRKAIRCLNSWNKSWGQYGKFWLREDDLAVLLADGGEACTAVEVQL